MKGDKAATSTPRTPPSRNERTAGTRGEQTAGTQGSAVRPRRKANPRVSGSDSMSTALLKQKGRDGGRSVARRGPPPSVPCPGCERGLQLCEVFLWGLLGKGTQDLPLLLLTAMGECTIVSTVKLQTIAHELVSPTVSPLTDERGRCSRPRRTQAPAPRPTALPQSIFVQKHLKRRTMCQVRGPRVREEQECACPTRTPSKQKWT